MSSKKVLIIFITKDSVMPEILDSAKNQDYQNCEVLVNVKEPQLLDDNSMKNFLYNMMINREETRKKALKTDADYFFLVDDDVKIPIDTVTKMMKQFDSRKTTIPFPMPDGTIIPKGTPVKEKHIIGGWYKHGDGDDWNAGRWVADNTFWNYKGPQAGMIPVHKIDMGCIMLSREYYSKITHHIVRAKEYEFYGSKRLSGFCECMGFAQDAHELGYVMWMNGAVICEHKKEERNARILTKTKDCC